MNFACKSGPTFPQQNMWLRECSQISAFVRSEGGSPNPLGIQWQKRALEEMPHGEPDDVTAYLEFVRLRVERSHMQELELQA